MELKCKRCGWKWDYKGKKKPHKEYAEYTSCPRCRTLVKIEKLENGT